MVRRNVLLGGMLGVGAGVYTVLATTLAGLGEGILIPTIVAGHVASASLLVFRYRRKGLGIIVEAVAAQLLAYIAFTPPLYTLALRFTT